MSNVQLGEKKDGTRYKVLVVDDSIFAVKQLAKMLQSENFEIAGTASDGDEAVDKYKKLYPNVDLVTLDITMPRSDGISALEKIIEFDKNARVIIVSALGKEDLVKKALLVGAKNYIIKPIDKNKVVEKIKLIIRGD